MEGETGEVHWEGFGEKAKLTLGVLGEGGGLKIGDSQLGKA